MNRHTGPKLRKSLVWQYKLCLRFFNHFISTLIISFFIYLKKTDAVSDLRSLYFLCYYSRLCHFSREIAYALTYGNYYNDIT